MTPASYTVKDVTIGSRWVDKFFGDFPHQVVDITGSKVCIAYDQEPGVDWKEISTFLMYAVKENEWER